MKMQLKNRKRNPNLSKYDAPLRIQFERGVKAFKGKQHLKTIEDNKIIATTSPYSVNSMQHREWQRGYNFAYFKNLKRVKNAEARRRSEEIHAR